MVENIISKIRKELKKNIDLKYKEGNQGFHREKIVCYGVRTPIVRKIGKKYLKEIKILGYAKSKIFSISEELLKSGYNEEVTIATQFVASLDFEKNEFKLFEKWVDKYLDNWGKIDDFCLHVINPIITQYPGLVNLVKKWVGSKNRWVRRASAVSFINTKGQFYATNQKMNNVFFVAKALLRDQDDLVQKGYGWMLKAASVHEQKLVFDFVMKHKEKMPRTALRYSIEKMPENLRKMAMKK